MYELDCHSLLDAGILMSILMYYVYVNSIDSIMNATDDSESEDTTNMDTTMNEQCKMIQNNDYSYYLYIDSTLYFGSSFTFDMAVVMLLMFSMRHCLSFEAISDLLHLIRLLLPNPTTIPTTLWSFRKYIKQSCMVTNKSHFFCTNCYDNLPTGNRTMWPTCKVTNQPQSFTILPVEEQISSLFNSIAIYCKLN